MIPPTTPADLNYDAHSEVIGALARHLAGLNAQEMVLELELRRIRTAQKITLAAIDRRSST